MIGILKKIRGGGVPGGLKWLKMKISPPGTPPPLIFFKNPIVLLLNNFLRAFGSAILFYQKNDFGGNIGFFRFFRFFQKNLKPKKCILGG